MKAIQGIYQSPQGHWVGDGFPVRTLFDYTGLGQLLNPFLLLDHAGPAEFTPTERPRGVGQHPHRGFETVTIVYEGEVAHRDSTGQGGVIGPGDVQWMTAGAGILHEEFHSPAFTKSGGRLHMVQLWVNLPARDKMTAPGYQAIVDAQIPRMPLAAAAGHPAHSTARVVAGEFAGVQGPTRTHTPMQVIDLQLAAGETVPLTLHAGWAAALIVVEGTVRVQDRAEDIATGQLVVLERAGTALTLRATSGARVLLLSGEPIDEPIAGQGPFVMNTRAEIHQAITDFNAGRFGRMAPV